MWNNIKQWAKRVKRSIFILYLASKDKRVPLSAKLFTAFIVAYAFSPIDLIPDFIPVLGYLDDVILLPIGIYFALRMIPKNVLAECELKAAELMKQGKPKNWIAGGIILFLWAAIATWMIYLIYGIIK
ncbi:YkvA family protein [Psychrobacillus sp. FSL H8-0483]|uniref:YkvA family protein n=1 Tax=Psychrobacillus sp. FSL H8-0483 TaxID=2921389 RepID=UPI00315A7090